MTKRGWPQKQWKTEDLTVYRLAIENARKDAPLWGTEVRDGDENPNRLAWPSPIKGYATALTYMDIYMDAYEIALNNLFDEMTEDEYTARRKLHRRNVMIHDSSDPASLSIILDLEDQVAALAAKVRELEDFDV